MAESSKGFHWAHLENVAFEIPANAEEEFGESGVRLAGLVHRGLRLGRERGKTGEIVVFKTSLDLVLLYDDKPFYQSWECVEALQCRQSERVLWISFRLLT